MARAKTEYKRKNTFKKGNKKSVGNKGRKGLTPIEKEQLLAIKVDSNLVKNYLTLNSHLTPEELVNRLQYERVSALEAMLIKSFLKAYNTGDFQMVNQILDRMIGKTPNVINHGMVNPLDGKSVEELQKMKRELEVQNRATMTYLEQHHPNTIETQQRVKERYKDELADVPSITNSDRETDQ